MPSAHHPALPARAANRWPQRLGIILGAVTMLSGCIGLGGKAPKELISLTPESRVQVGQANTAMAADAFVLMDPVADRTVDVLRVPVRVDASTVAYLKDIGWVEKPSHQFRSLLAETLRSKTSRLVVEEGDSDIIGRTQVGSHLLAMGYDAPSSSVVVRIDVQRREKNGPIATRRFEATVPGVAAKAKPVAAALGQAVNDVTNQVADWLTQ